MWQLSDLKTIQILFQNSPNTKKKQPIQSIRVGNTFLDKGEN